MSVQQPDVARRAKRAGTLRSEAEEFGVKKGQVYYSVSTGSLFSVVGARGSIATVAEHEIEEEGCDVAYFHDRTAKSLTRVLSDIRRGRWQLVGVTSDTAVDKTILLPKPSTELFAAARKGSPVALLTRVEPKYDDPYREFGFTDAPSPVGMTPLTADVASPVVLPGALASRDSQRQHVLREVRKLGGNVYLDAQDGHLWAVLGVTSKQVVIRPFVLDGQDAWVDQDLLPVGRSGRQVSPFTFEQDTLARWIPIGRVANPGADGFRVERTAVQLADAFARGKVQTFAPLAGRPSGVATPAVDEERRATRQLGKLVYDSNDERFYVVYARSRVHRQLVQDENGDYKSVRSQPSLMLSNVRVRGQRGSSGDVLPLTDDKAVRPRARSLARFETELSTGTLTVVATLNDFENVSRVRLPQPYAEMVAAARAGTPVEAVAVTRVPELTVDACVGMLFYDRRFRQFVMGQALPQPEAEGETAVRLVPKIVSAADDETGPLPFVNQRRSRQVPARGRALAEIKTQVAEGRLIPVAVVADHKHADEIVLDEPFADYLQHRVSDGLLKAQGLTSLEAVRRRNIDDATGALTFPETGQGLIDSVIHRASTGELSERQATRTTTVIELSLLELMGEDWRSGSVEMITRSQLELAQSPENTEAVRARAVRNVVDALGALRTLSRPDLRPSATSRAGLLMFVDELDVAQPIKTRMKAGVRAILGESDNISGINVLQVARDAPLDGCSEALKKAHRIGFRAAMRAFAADERYTGIVQGLVETKAQVSLDECVETLFYDARAKQFMLGERAEPNGRVRSVGVRLVPVKVESALGDASGLPDVDPDRRMTPPVYGRSLETIRDAISAARLIPVARVAKANDGPTAVVCISTPFDAAVRSLDDLPSAQGLSAETTTPSAKRLRRTGPSLAL